MFLRPLLQEAYTDLMKSKIKPNVSDRVEPNAAESLRHSLPYAT